MSGMFSFFLLAYICLRFYKHDDYNVEHMGAFLKDPICTVDSVMQLLFKNLKKDRDNTGKRFFGEDEILMLLLTLRTFFTPINKIVRKQ